jgi:DNA polymerase-3 subunit epsilon
MRQIVLDTETTGLSADGGDRIIEIGCVELVGRKLTGNNRHYYLNPGRDSHEDALKVHGISNEFLRDKPKFAQVAEELCEYLAGAEVIIHNAAFDVGFLDKEFELCGRVATKHVVGSVTDTLRMAKEIYPGKRNSLDSLCDRLGVDNSSRTLHGALLDAELLADVYIYLTRGQNALMIDTHTAEVGGSTLPVVDLSAFALPVILANEQESMAHDGVLVGLEKAAGKPALWRNINPAMS